MNIYFTIKNISFNWLKTKIKNRPDFLSNKIVKGKSNNNNFF